MTVPQRAQVTHIQTGAERAHGEPGRAHDETVHERVQCGIAETQAGIAKARANVEYLNRTGHFPH